MALLDIDVDAAEATVAELQTDYPDVRAIETDVTSESSVKAGVREAVAMFGGLTSSLQTRRYSCLTKTTEQTGLPLPSGRGHSR